MEWMFDVCECVCVCAGKKGHGSLILDEIPIDPFTSSLLIPSRLGYLYFFLAFCKMILEFRRFCWDCVLVWSFSSLRGETGDKDKGEVKLSSPRPLFETRL